MSLIEDLREGYAWEEEIISAINSMLTLFLGQTDLPEEKRSNIKTILESLTRDTERHKKIIEEIMKELEADDN